MKKLILLIMLLWGPPLWAQEVIIRALADGAIVRQAAKVGQKVHKGALLVVIDPASWQAKVVEAKALVEQAQLKLQDAELDLREKQDLYDRTVLAKRELQRMQTRHELARQALKAAEARLQALRALERYYRIRAPYGAKVVRVYAPLGSTVYRGMALIGLEKTE